MSSDKKVVGCLFVAIVLMWFAYPYVTRLWVESRLGSGMTNASGSAPNGEIASEHRGWERSGQHGDTYGGVTSLFTALALLAAGYAAYLQHRDLEVQKRNIAAAHVPAVEWDAPIIRIIGLIDNPGAHPALAISIDTIVSNWSNDSAINFISRGTLYDAKGVAIAVGAASNEGYCVNQGKSVRGFHYIVIKDETHAIRLLESLVTRENVALKFESWCTNSIAAPFYRSKSYMVDCPSNHARDYCKRLSERLRNHTICAIDNDALNQYESALYTAVIGGTDVFTNEFATAISKVEPLESKIVDVSEYERARGGVWLTLRDNLMPIKRARESFYIVWRK